MMSAIDSDEVEYFTTLSKVNDLVTDLSELCNLRIAELVDMVGFVNSKDAHIEAFVNSLEPEKQVYINAHKSTFHEWLYDSFLDLSLTGMLCIEGVEGNEAELVDTIDITLDNTAVDMEECTVQKNFAGRCNADEDGNVSVSNRKLDTVEKGRNGGTFDGSLSSTQVSDSSVAAEMLVAHESKQMQKVVNVRTVVQEYETTSIRTKSQTDFDSGSDDGHPPPVPGWKPKLSDVQVRYNCEMRGYKRALEHYKYFKKNGASIRKPKKPKSVEERMMSREELRAFRAQQAKEVTEQVTIGSGTESSFCSDSDSDEDK